MDKKKDTATLRRLVDSLTRLTPAEMASAQGRILLDEALAVPDLKPDLVIEYELGMEPSSNRRLQDLDNQAAQLEGEVRELNADMHRLLKLAREKQRQKAEAQKYLRDVEAERSRLVEQLDRVQVAS